MKSKPSKPFSFNSGAHDFVPSFGDPSSTTLHLFVGAAEFVPQEAPSEEVKVISTAEVIEQETLKPVVLTEECKAPLLKQYTRAKLLELKESAQILTGISVPDYYAIRLAKKGGGGKKKKRAAEEAITRAVSIFESSTILKKVDNSFASSVKTNTDEFERTVRSVRATLNKLSPQNFERLSEKLLSDYEYTPELLERLVDLIFERVTAQHGFIEMYTRLCKLIVSRLKEKGPEMSRSFRISLLTKSEQCFYGEEAPQASSETMDAVFKQRRRLVGNSKFICQLYLTKMLKDKHMLECFEQLLADANISDEGIETYCTLFKTTAPLLIVKDAKKTRHYYQRIEALYNDPRLVKRIHFLILDVIESSEKLLSLVGERPTRKDEEIKIADVLSSPVKSKYRDDLAVKPRHLDYDEPAAAEVSTVLEESPSKKRISEEAKVRLR
jgi:hypothetical protein